MAQYRPPRDDDHSYFDDDEYDDKYGEKYNSNYYHQPETDDLNRHYSERNRDRLNHGYDGGDLTDGYRQHRNHQNANNNKYHNNNKVHPQHYPDYNDQSGYDPDRDRAYYRDKDNAGNRGDYYSDRSRGQRGHDDSAEHANINSIDDYPAPNVHRNGSKDLYTRPHFRPTLHDDETQAASHTDNPPIPTQPDNTHNGSVSEYDSIRTASETDALSVHTIMASLRHKRSSKARNRLPELAHSEKRDAIERQLSTMSQDESHTRKMAQLLTKHYREELAKEQKEKWAL